MTSEFARCDESIYQTVFQQVVAELDIDMMKKGMVFELSTLLKRYRELAGNRISNIENYRSDKLHILFQFLLTKPYRDCIVFLAQKDWKSIVVANIGVTIDTVI